MTDGIDRLSHAFSTLVLTAALFLAGVVVLPWEVGAAVPQVQDIQDPAFQDSIRAEYDIESLPGFEVQLIYEVPLEEQGSWVALANLPNGDIVASDQDDEGLFRVDVGGGVDDPTVEVEEITFPLSGAQGLEWAFDQLYVNINAVGLFKLWNSDSDEFNMSEYATNSPDGGGEHGNHSVEPTPDGENLYVIYGNHSPLPDEYSSRVKSWEEDILLPRNWDARGHARGILAPGGYITRINPDATEWEIQSIGYRNAYDFAVNQHGEVFAYDADMEWDMGLPWYRPTRVVHAVSGADFGWRSGSGKWKTYFEDSLPATYNIGPGSPTGLLFGTDAAFPARYQRAMYALDWTFGTLRAVHLAPDGASYESEGEEFVTGSPLPLTDAVVGADGHFYFATGGRGGESRLWRVVYTGDESTAPVGPEIDPEAQEARQLRQRLESFHGEEDPQALDAAWPHLDSQDRFIRNAARVAVEWQPVEDWAERALEEDRPQARITGLTALARTAPSDYRNDALASLLEMDLDELSANQKLSYLRAMSLVFQRLGSPNQELSDQIADKLQPFLPSEDDRINVELVRTLVFLEDERVIDKALTLMDRESDPPILDWDSTLLARSERYGGTIREIQENPPPTYKLEYAYMLRNMRYGWTIDQRREYFSFINEAADRAGGASYTGFLERMREEALSNATEEEIEAVSDLTGVSLAQEPDFEIVPPQGPGREWTIESALDVVEDNLANADFERGRSLFHAVQCASCHRFAGYGGNIGPDLSSVGNRFDEDEILQEIINPSEIISDQYSSSQVRMENGETHVGLVVERENELEIYSQDPNAEPTVVPRSEVQTISQVSTSQMPPGLINPLNPRELRDLMAYLMSGGDPESDVYVPESEEEDDEDEEDEDDD